MEFINTIRQIITNPGLYFDSVKEEEGYMKPWLHFIKIMSVYLLLAFIAYIPATFVSIFFQQALVSSSAPELSGTAESVFGVPSASLMIIIMFFLYLAVFALSAGGIFISAGINHLFLKIVGSGKTYDQTFKIVAYSSTPLVFLGPLSFITVIPFIGGLLFSACSMAVTIGTMILEVIGAKRLHEIDTFRAVLAMVIIPIVLTLIIIVILFVVAVVALRFIMVPMGSGGITGMVANSI